MCWIVVTTCLTNPAAAHRGPAQLADSHTSHPALACAPTVPRKLGRGADNDAHRQLRCFELAVRFALRDGRGCGICATDPPAFSRRQVPQPVAASQSGDLRGAQRRSRFKRHTCLSGFTWFPRGTVCRWCSLYRPDSLERVCVPPFVHLAPARVPPMEPLSWIYMLP